jgi:putative Mg2+ transporter-C (MgtC) family protein
MMSLQVQAETVALLLIAALLSMIIGLDRERRDRPAGLRTHMLVGVGACLFTILSIYAFPSGDPGRVASQILPGIGFLGAGAILKQRRDISGLTTAASVWSTAAVGMAVGTGAWLLALAATVIIWIILVLLSKAENHQKRNDESDLSDDSGEPMPLHDNISGGGHVREVHPLDD